MSKELKTCKPHVDDLVWIDKDGLIHTISEMDISYVEAVIGFLDKKGYRNFIPNALFKRYKERHNIIANEFEEI